MVTKRVLPAWAVTLTLGAILLAQLFHQTRSSPPGDRLIHSPLGQEISRSVQAIHDQSETSREINLKQLDQLEAKLKEHDLMTPTIAIPFDQIRQAVAKNDRDAIELWEDELAENIHEMLILRPAQ